MAWEYKVVPFAAGVKAGGNRTEAVAGQFEGLLTNMQAQGFEYFRMDHYSLVEKPGCLAGLFGASPSSITYDVAIFRRSR